MKTLQDKWNKLHVAQKISVVFLLLALVILTILGCVIPKLGIALLVVAFCFGIAAAIATLLVNPFN